MTDEPNRPATRMDFTTIREMEDLGRTMFLDGIVEGLPIAKNVKLIIEQAVLFGRDEAGRSDSFYASVRCGNIEDLTRAIVRQAVDDMFGGVGMDKVAHAITLSGMAYGFESEKRKMNTSAIDAVLAKLLSEHKANAVTEETLDEYFSEVLKIEDPEVSIEYARKLLTEHKVPMTTKLPNFKLFVAHYSQVIMAA